MRTAFRIVALALGLIVLVDLTPALALEQTGMVGWYGGTFHGNRTASGERFRSDALTIAHRSLPFGAEVRITNVANGRSVTARVNDRGPRHRGRIADLSYRTAKELGFVRQGVTRAKLEVVSLR
jgi:rare lipoprotein A